MACLLLRLAGPVQSWAGYRRDYFYVGTHAVPTRSGVAGLLGAAVGEPNSRLLIPQFELQVRVDRTNPAQVDFQTVASPSNPRDADNLRRAHKISIGGRSEKIPSNPTGSGAGAGAIYHREFLPYAEFICAISSGRKNIDSWLAAVKDPVFTLYLGRHPNVPTWPFILGVSDDESVLTRLPRVPGGNSSSEGPVAIHQVGGDYDLHTTDFDWVDVPVASDRREQMLWAASNLEY